MAIWIGWAPLPGTPGILVRAKLAGHLPSACDATQTRKQRGIWLDETVLAKVLLLAGEAFGGEYSVRPYSCYS